MGPAEPCRLEDKQTNKQTKQMQKFNKQTNTHTQASQHIAHTHTHKQTYYKMRTWLFNFITIVILDQIDCLCFSGSGSLFFVASVSLVPASIIWLMLAGLYSERQTSARVQSPQKNNGQHLCSAANLSQLCSSQCTGHEFPLPSSQ
jgi:hypothetical protein